VKNKKNEIESTVSVVMSKRLDLRRRRFWLWRRRKYFWAWL